MNRSKRLLVAFAVGLGFFFYFVLICGGLFALGMPIGLPVLLLLMMMYGWIIYAFIHYREGRQQEVTHLLCTAAESQAPLAPALWAYLEDRPRGTLREFWTGSLLLFVLPGYYWIWHRRHSQDRKVARVAQFLEMGDSLPDALKAAPGVVSSEMVLAAQIGEVTGRLADSLGAALPRRLTAIWLEMLPRFLYPILLVLFIINLLGFWTTYILPKMEKIYGDFGAEMPRATMRVVAVENFVIDHLGTLMLTLLIVGILAGFFFSSSKVRWHFPILGRLYRRHQQSNVLKMLGVLLKVDMPAPRALGLLAGSDYFASAVRKRLLAAERRVSAGEPLAESLLRSGLLQSSTVSLVQAAGRAQNLPWALAELGDTLAERTVRALRRISQFTAPLLVMAVGLLVGIIVIGMFVPMIDLITRLAE